MDKTTLNEVVFFILCLREKFVTSQDRKNGILYIEKKGRMFININKMNMKKKIISVVLCLIVIFGVITIFAMYNKDDREMPIAIVNQNAAEEKMQEEYEAGTWTMDEPYIKVNPYDTNELSAYLAFEADQASTWAYTVKGKTEEVDFSYSTDKASKEILIPIFGLYSGQNTVNITFTAKDGTETEKEYSITTDDMSSNAVEWHVKDKDQFTTIMGTRVFVDNYTNIYDSNGDIRVSGLVPYTHYGYLKLVNGKLLVVASQDKSDPLKTIYETNLMGRLNPDYFMLAPDGLKFHHDFIGVDGKTYALTSPSENIEEDTIKESKIAVYNKRGRLIDEYDMADYLVQEGNMVAANSVSYDVHLNGIDYIKEENQLVLSSRSYSAIYGFDLDTKEIAWAIDDPNTTTIDNVLSPIGEVDYASGQHTPIVLTEDMDLPYFEREEGKYYISIFDNQSSINSNGDEVYKPFEGGEHSDSEFETGNAQGIIYAIDLNNMTVEEVSKVTGNYQTPFMGSYRPESEYQELYISIPGEYELFDTEGNLVADGFLTNSLESGMSEDEPFSYRARIVSVSDLLNLQNNY